MHGSTTCADLVSHCCSCAPHRSQGLSAGRRRNDTWLFSRCGFECAACETIANCHTQDVARQNSLMNTHQQAAGHHCRNPSRALSPPFIRHVTAPHCYNMPRDGGRQNTLSRAQLSLCQTGGDNKRSSQTCSPHPTVCLKKPVMFFEDEISIIQSASPAKKSPRSCSAPHAPRLSRSQRAGGIWSVLKLSGCYVVALISVPYLLLALRFTLRSFFLDGYAFDSKVMSRLKR